MIISNKIITFILLVLSALLFAYLIDTKELYDQTLFYIFQARDIERAKNLLNGKLIFFGPEMTGGGNLPGPLYYIFVSIALFFKQNWISVWIMQYLLAFFAGIVGAFYIKSISTRMSGLLWFIFFVTAPLTFRFLQVFLNVSCLLIFTVAALVLINKSFYDENPNTRARAYIFACFIIGVGIQFHYSIISLLLSLFFMQFFGFKLSLPALPKKILLMGMVAFLVPSVPYLIWMTFSKFGISLGDPGQYTGEAHKALSSIVSLIKFDFNVTKNGLALESLRKIIFTFPFPLLIILGVHVSGFFKRFKFSEEELQNKKPLLLKPFIICLIFSTAPYLDWYFSSQAVRYTMPFYVCILFITIILFQNIARFKSTLTRFNIVSAFATFLFWFWVYLNFPAELRNKYFAANVVLIFVILCFSIFIEKNNLKKTWPVVLGFIFMAIINQGQMFTKDFKNHTPLHWALFMPQTYEWDHIWKTIYRDSGWNYEEASKRIYYVGHHLEQDPQLFLTGFNYFSGEFKKREIQPDGYFISNKFRLQQDLTPSLAWPAAFKNPKAWMLKQNLQPEIIDAIESRDIRLGKNISDKILIIPYWVKNNKNVPQYFHNSGLGYKLTKEDLKLGEVAENEGVKKLSPNQFLFKWNESPDQSPYCSTGALVALNESIKGKFIVSIKVVGGTISQISPWVSPNWTQAWIGPYLEIECNNKIERFLISKSIGFRRDISHNTQSPLLQGNNSFVAPFERSFSFSCAGPLTHLSLGRESSTVETIRSILNLPPKKLSVKI